jgi:GDP-D-mannose 3',5'-epimerase
MSGTDSSVYASSTIVQTSAPKELGQLRQADGEEGFAAKAAAKVAALANGLANGAKAAHQGVLSP